MSRLKGQRTSGLQDLHELFLTVPHSCPVLDLVLQLLHFTLGDAPVASFAGNEVNIIGVLCLGDYQRIIGNAKFALGLVYISAGDKTLIVTDAVAGNEDSHNGDDA